MSKLTSFKVEYLKRMTLRKLDQDLLESIQPESIPALENKPLSYTLWIEDRPVMCIGATQYWKDRAELWVILDQNCKKDFLKIHHATKIILSNLPQRRLEAVVELDYEPGHRWAKLMGFELEAPFLHRYFPTGQNASLYSKVRDI